MPDFAAFVPVVNRPDLFFNVIDAVRPLWEGLTIVDNSPERWVSEAVASRNPGLHVYVPPVPLWYTQVVNWTFEETIRQNKKICVWMHSDAVIPEGACEALLDFTRKTDAENPRWAVIYTNYDVLCAYNIDVFREIGGYDTNFPNYHSDCDWYRRVDLAGWTRINSGIEVGHVGSQTINSDGYLKHVNSIMFPYFQQYYTRKWGGNPGHEILTVPFGVRPEDWSKLL